MCLNKHILFLAVIFLWKIAQIMWKCNIYTHIYKYIYLIFKAIFDFFTKHIQICSHGLLNKFVYFTKINFFKEYILENIFLRKMFIWIIFKGICIFFYLSNYVVFVTGYRISLLIYWYWYIGLECKILKCIHLCKNIGFRCCLIL